jgi:hypothetical protein
MIRKGFQARDGAARNLKVSPSNGGLPPTRAMDHLGGFRVGVAETGS